MATLVQVLAPKSIYLQRYTSSVIAGGVHSQQPLCAIERMRDRAAPTSVLAADRNSLVWRGVRPRVEVTHH
eukprot:CAMPEP_0180041858 /NCGR_PEP_ID=MMETSP0984-20121128/34398_1 /TAXON_ID=483367 /ORGANISM="non described non described, Strain CCMP 2436" /LENGTH=70 /DNA_ID=CAMNT_0021969555 /DNA_START=53 /DNA_END=265 /DNA_ORIENTATION=+